MCTSRPSRSPASSTRCCPWNRLRKRSKWCIPIRRRLPSASAGCVSTCRSLSYGLRFHRRRRAPGVSEPGSAAIGHKSLSTMLGLPILAYNLEDEPTNQTRFVVIGPKPRTLPQPTRLRYCSRCLTSPALWRVFWICCSSGGESPQAWSRAPCALRAGNTPFRRSRDEPAQARASGVLAELRNTCHSFRLLGCYTAGE